MEKATLISELNLGRELAEELKKQLNHHQLCESLLQKIVSSYDKAISMINCVISPSSPELRQANSNGCSRKRKALSDPDILASNKRKKMQKWSQLVRASEGAGILDGFSWRKYGQKDIHGANFPRAYYRCTHRHVQGCLATKQVQRSDEDLSLFEVTYKGRHTCIQSKVPKMVLKLEHGDEDGEGVVGIQETLETGIDLIGDGDQLSMFSSNEILETLTVEPKKEERLMVKHCSSPFDSPKNFDSVVDCFQFPSFPSFETEQFFEGLDYDTRKMCDWSEFDGFGFDVNLSVDILDFL
ncbi:probable WRKY transcription factor 30 [Impatiens glandulifera]|uniref:probable WRKY transcription factor 30 n=1 Tax=Impatiens glandulifera TaxID=253017 RepID=UPI001FB1322D|nr:probable WRKY transcription factor 30 [Impatiens glandulifera]